MSLDRYFKRVSDVDPVRAAARLEKLLSCDQILEADLQKFLSENVYLLFQLAPRHSLFAVAQARLDDSYVVDFALYGEANINWWTFIEIERPSAQLFTKSGDPAKDLTHALQQTYDWQRWKEHSSMWVTLFGDSTPPILDTVLVIGRRGSLNRKSRERLKSYGLTYTYDSLLEIARSCSSLRPDVVVQSDAIPWSNFKTIRHEIGLGGFWQQIERITGVQVYARVADFSREVSEEDVVSTLKGKKLYTSEAIADEVVGICGSYCRGDHIPAPRDAILAQFVAYLNELKSIRWGQATRPPKTEIAAYQMVMKAWGRMANAMCHELLIESLQKRFGPRTDDVVHAVFKAVGSVGIWHFEGIRTCQNYGLSILVPGWCEPTRDIYAAEMALLRAGGQVASNLLINRNLDTLAVLW
ncbi:MAG: DUF4263 domain-containing protein [Candidatus Aminicenantes bacterium]|nr:DUF4263 domain-containing protein [Candidatus Aminicenantes bacterium]NIM83403.1 DUF4263 domain-containing protein [Candidatus Aminicenantes bacterium]NIN22795.1 DUF4263 domain-containing protein [Candidatus Aminicenantes bacterium]NIN46529.1 DUF4263 domain-containing protein [Candidatus Aminicenantes bacterium]NIN89434.1 DUF4263 domain-containing protein [Candidatus Aminicenantes bacterium]